MNKVKFKVNIKIISLLVLLLAFLMLPFGQFEPTTAEGEYQISTEAGLKDWLQNTNNIQTNNPNAVLTSNITIDWSGVAPTNAIIQNSAVLDGDDFTITIGGGDVTVGETKQDFLGLFVTQINNATLKNMKFRLAGNRNITIGYETAKDNQRIFTGVVSAQIINGNVYNCQVTLDTYFRFWNECENSALAYSDSSSNHFGVIAGWLEGNSVIKNCQVIQQQSSTIILESSNRDDHYMRIGFIASDSYKNDSGIPQIINTTIERWGYLELYNRNWASDGNCLYGIIVADMSTTSDNDKNHAVNIDGVIYNGVGGSVTNQITYEKDTGGEDLTHSYFTGRNGVANTSCTINNVYSYVEFSDTANLAIDTGMAVIPEGLNVDFDKNNDGQIIISRQEVANEFLWSIDNADETALLKTYTMVSNSVNVNKFNTPIASGQNKLGYTLGQIIDSAIVGFESAQVVYSGVAFQNVRIRIGDEIISSGFGVDYSNNLNSSVTSGTNATFALQYPDREDGIFLTTQKYFVEKSGISYDNKEMTINPAPLTITYTEGDVYTNNLSIFGLVNGQQVTIDSAKYGNGSTSFDCLNNSTTKTISFTDGVIETNYAITQNGLEDLTFEVSPKTISISEGITVTNADGNNAVFSENVLTIYSKNYQTIELEYSQPVGYLNRVDLTSSEGHSFNISSSLNDNVMSNTISSDIANELHYLDSIVLNESLQKVAVKIDIIDTSLISNLTINGQRPVKYGDYLLIDADYGEELEFVVALLDDYQDYTISYTIGEQSNSIEGNSFKINALPQANNMLTISINMTAPSSQN